MPRAAWLAIGAATGALVLGVAPALALALLALGLLALGLAARAVAWRVVPGWVNAVAVGMLLIGLRAGLGGPAAAPGPIPTGNGPWIGIVEGVGAPRQGQRPATVRLDGQAPTLVAATLPWYPPVVPGDRLELRGRVRPPPPDDYGAYLARIGAAGTLRADSLAVLPAEDSVARTLEGFRRAAAEGLDRSLPEPEAGLAAGVLIGLRDRVDRELAAAFTTAGASHVVAISGWNIAIVASTLAAVAGGMRRRRRALLTAVAIFVYVAFVGPSPSVVRAGAMAGVALLARELGRPGTAAAALGWACATLLLLDPAYVDDAGFRLSVLATAGILAWGTSLTARLAGPQPGRARRWVADILGVSFAAQAATTPIVLLDFGRLSVVAPAVNLLVVPLVPAAMAAGALALVVGMLAGAGIPGVIAVVVGLPAWVLYAAMVTVVRVGASLPLASLSLDPPWDVVAAAVSLLLIAAGARWSDALAGAARAALGPARPAAASAVPHRRARRQRRPSRAARLAGVALAAATIGLALAAAHRPDGAVHVVVLDVGQGDGILVEGGFGGRMVVDGGPDPGRLVLALDERLPPWDRRIDILVLTHPHEDHVAGLAQLLARYRVGRVYEPGMIGPGPGYRAWEDAFMAGGPPHGRLSTGDRLTLDQVRFRVLWPDANRVPERPPDGGTGINNVSIVLLGEVGGQRFLLAGDVEEGVDPELLARGVPRVDLLKVAHHGSGTATTRAFLEAALPRVAVVSAGAGNPYGHPATTTIQRLHELAGRTYRTDTDGTVDIALDGSSVRVRTSGARPGPNGATPRTASTARAGSFVPASATAPVRAGGETFLCAVAPDPAPSTVVASGARLPAAPPWPPLPAIHSGRDEPRAANREPRLGRLPEPVIGAAIGLRYHPDDGQLPRIGDRAAPRDGSPRLLLGRRRVRTRRGRGRLPGRSQPLPGRPAGALAAGDRSRRPRPPPGRDP